MKRIILAIAVTACFISQINAQFHFGVKGGINFQQAKLAKTDLAVKNSTGWQAGALLQVKVPGVGLAVQPELLYTASKVSLDGVSNTINYFEVPINVHWGPKLLLVHPYLQAGPYFAYALSSGGEQFKDNINKFDWGIGLGGGVEFWKLQIDARYSWGLQNVSGVKDFEMKNNRFTLSLGFFFL